MPGHFRNVIWVLTLLTFPACAADHFLTIGGGPSPSNNQVSLEKNVLYFQRLLAEWGLSGAPHTVFFADGRDEGRDLQYDDPDLKMPRANELLARLTSREENLHLQYRSSRIPDVAGPATRKSLDDFFTTATQKLKEQDRLFIYFTGHGGRGAESAKRNTTITLWEDRSMPVREFVGLLDKLPAGVQVVMVMVQCHAGGFADVIFEKAEVGPMLSGAKRCGFFATVPERSAAGCTADIDEEDYHEYSTSFFAALSGKDRLGNAVEKPDYNGDGRTSFDEAHAYVLIHSDTIDIPIATSDVFLRQFSRMRGEGDRLVTPEDRIETLLKWGTPSQRAVLEALSTKLRVFGPSRTNEVRRLVEKIEKDKKSIEQARSRFMREYNRQRLAIRSHLLTRWPELSNPLNPTAMTLLQNEGEAIVREVESHAQYKRWEQLTDRVNEQSERLSQLERQWVKAQRFLYVAESVALAANLKEAAPVEMHERFKVLRAGEGGGMK